MTAGVFPLMIDKFAEFLVYLQYADENGPKDLTNFRAQMDIAHSFTPVCTLVPNGFIWGMSTDDMYGSITFPYPKLGITRLYIPAAITNTFTFEKAVYALMFLPPFSVDPIRILQGTMLLSPGIKVFQTP